MVNEKEIIKLNLEGKKNSEIRLILGFSLTTISKYLKKNKLSNNYTNINLLSLVLMLHNSGKTNSEISKELNMSKTTARKYLVKYLNVSPNSSKKKTIKEKIILNRDLSELIYGSLLGDLSIDKSHKSFRISISHGGKQEEYFNHKCLVLSNILGYVIKKPRFDKRTNKNYIKLLAKTLSNSTFNDIYNETYINGKKTVTLNWLNKLTAKSLAYWFMDDGTNSGVLATNCFSVDEVILIQKWFKEKYDIDTTIHLLKKTQPILYFTKSGKLKFYILTHKYFLPSMLYKIKNWNP